MENSKMLSEVADSFYEFVLKNLPTEAIFLGEMEYANDIEDISESADQERRSVLSDLLSELTKVDKTLLSRQQAVTYGMLHYEITTAIDEIDDKSIEIASGLIGIQDYVIVYPSQIQIANEEQADSILKRIELHSRLFEQAIERHKAGLSRGWVNAERNISATSSQLKKYLDTDVNNDSLIGMKMPTSMEGKKLEEWKAKAIKIIETKVRPSILKYTEFCDHVLAPKGRSDEKFGIMWVPGGKEYYSNTLKKHTGHDNETAQTIHDYGKSEISRLLGEFEKLGANVFGKYTGKEIIKKMQTEPSMRYKNADEMMSMARTAIERAWKAVPQMFNNIPKAECIVTEVPPESAENAPPAFYFSPTPDGSRPGIYYNNTYKAEDKSRFEAETIAFHEAVPGHHFDRAIAVELTDVPKFQKFASTTAFVEGWGLYAEQLANEHNLFSDDVQKLGFLANDAWRSCRLVIDTGIHAFGWTRQQAIEYFLEHAPIEHHNAHAETDRYSAWAGQACAYKMGQRKINQLRKFAKQELEDKFDLKEFHDEVLKDGGLTLNVFEEKMHAWINAKK